MGLKLWELVCGTGVWWCLSYWLMAVLWHHMEHRLYTLNFTSLTLNCLKKDTQACPKHGNVTQHIVPISGNQLTYLTIRRSLSRELNAALWCWRNGNINAHYTMLNKCMLIHNPWYSFHLKLKQTTNGITVHILSLSYQPTSPLASAKDNCKALREQPYRRECAR